MSLDEEAAGTEARSRERFQDAVPERLHRAAPLADEMIVVVVGEPKMGRAPEVDLLDDPGGPEPLEDAVDGHQA